MLTPEVFCSFSSCQRQWGSIASVPKSWKKMTNKVFCLLSLHSIPRQYFPQVKIGSRWFLMERKLTETAALRKKGKGGKKSKQKKKNPNPLKSVHCPAVMSPDEHWPVKKCDCISADMNQMHSIYLFIKAFMFFSQKKQVFCLGVAYTRYVMLHKAPPCWNFGSGAGWGVVYISTVLSAELFNVERVLVDAGGNLSWADTVLCGSALHTIGYNHKFALKGW